ncbi:large-conductance mechanosensitive channel [Clostridium sp. CAG:567]|jgi:large conductance mechanosensitive channel|nr:large-conductance mechanosensitive channel [Clostridium sp. CAG:567]
MKKVEMNKKMKEEIRKAQKGAKEEAGEFKKFISKGNVVDMAVGVIIGGSFGKIVTSLVNDIITPIIGIIIGGIDFSNLSIQINDAKIMYGNFIQTIIDFLIIAICIFTVIRTFEKIKNKNKKEEVVVEKPKKSDEVLLLEEIRDLLKKETSEKEEKV